MKQKTINLYLFEELSEEQQKQVIENYRDFNDDIFDSYAQDECSTLEIHENGFLNPTIHYSLNYCQGDGACFDCNDFDFDLLLKDWKHKHKKWIVEIIKSHYQGYINKNQFGYHYSHEKTRYFELSEDFMTSYYYIEKAVAEAEKHIENLRYELSKSLTNRLYEQLEYLRDDEQIKETLIANEYLFNEETLRIDY